jgi:hypothetical protein
LPAVTEVDAGVLVEAVDVVASAFLRGKSSERALAMQARSTSKGVKNCITAVQRRLFLVRVMDGCFGIGNKRPVRKSWNVRESLWRTTWYAYAYPLLSRFPCGILPTPADAVLHQV